MRRRPKQLDEAPLLFRPGVHGAPLVPGPGQERSDGVPTGQPPAVAAQGWLATDERGERRTLDELGPSGPVDPQVRRTARAIARQLSVRWRSTDQRDRAGSSGRPVSVPYRYGSDDIDLDRTLEVLTERPVPDDTDIIVRERMRSRRALALVVDVSGSMRGEKVHIAAATVAALAAELADDELAVVAFWKHAAVIKPIDRARPAAGILDDLLRVPAKGLTNVGFGLAVALDELGRARARGRSTVLLTDAVHNAGPDPRPTAARTSRLHVLLEVAGEHDAELAADLARLGGGQVHPVRSHRDVAPALNRALAR